MPWPLIILPVFLCQKNSWSTVNWPQMGASSWYLLTLGPRQTIEIGLHPFKSWQVVKTCLFRQQNKTSISGAEQRARCFAFFQLPHVASTRTSGNLEPILVHGIWTECHIWSPRSYSHPKIYIYNSHSPRRFLTLRKTNIAGWKMENTSSNGKCYRRAISSIHYWRVDAFIEKKKYIRFFFQHLIITLQGINISHLGKRKIIFPTAFGWDILVSRRVRVSVSSPLFFLVLFASKSLWIISKALTVTG